MKKSIHQLILLSFIFLLASAFVVISLKPADSENAITFVIKNLGINTKGELSGLKGSIDWNEDSPGDSKIAVTAESNTLNTGIDARDNHLKKEEWFDVAQYPELKIISTSIAKNATGYTLNGMLTIKGVTKNVSFPFTVTKNTDGYLFNGKFTINRRDFGVGGNSVTLSDNVDITLNVTAK